MAKQKKQNHDKSWALYFDLQSIVHRDPVADSIINEAMTLLSKGWFYRYDGD